MVPQKVHAVERTSESISAVSSGTENERRQSVQVTTKYPVSLRGIQTGALSGFATFGRSGDCSMSWAILRNSSSGAYCPFVKNASAISPAGDSRLNSPEMATTGI